MIGTPGPIGNRLYKPMMNGVGVDVMDDISKMIIAFNFLSFEIGNEEAARAAIHFIEGFGIRIEKIAKLLRYSLFEGGKTSKAFRNLGGLDGGLKNFNLSKSRNQFPFRFYPD